jgi:hypothetical protein
MVQTASRCYLRHSTSGDLVARSSQSDVAWIGSTPLTATLVRSKTDRRAAVIRLRGEVHLDPATFAAGRPLSRGTWQLLLRFQALGATRSLAVSDQTALRLPKRAGRVRGTAKLRLRRGGRLVLVVEDGS